MSSTKWSVSIACLLSGILSAGCSGNECEDARVRPCYTGGVGTSGIGLCRDGVQRCVDGKWEGQCLAEVVPEEERCDQVDNDCDGEVDEEVRNACGGCSRLPGAPDEPCPGCGTWICDGKEALVCVPQEAPAENLCGEGSCQGLWVCGEEQVFECKMPSRPNECGVCGGNSVDDLGDTCTTASGCAGERVCNALGSASVCDGPSPNNCGVCGAQNVPGVGGACISTDGCAGTLRCTEDGTDSFCDAPAKNNCGACGEPDIVGVGDECGMAGACAGELGCNAAGDGTVCVFPGFGEECEGDNGCSGTIECDESGAGTACVAPDRNACGECGGPEVTGVGDACVTSTGCEGTYACNGAGDDVLCIPTEACLPTTNHVVISEIAVEGPNGNGDEFIELYNPTNDDISLANWSLHYRSNDGNAFLIVLSFPEEAMIAARGYVLTGSDRNSRGYGGSVAADFKFAGGSNAQQLSAKGGQLFLASKKSLSSTSDAAIIDMVGWGSAVFFEGKGTGGKVATKQAVEDGSIERKAHPDATAASMAPGGPDQELGNAQDTQDNGSDFIQRTLRDPQNSASPREPPQAAPTP